MGGCTFSAKQQERVKSQNIPRVRKNKKAKGQIQLGASHARGAAAHAYVRVIIVDLCIVRPAFACCICLVVCHVHELI